MIERSTGEVAAILRDGTGIDHAIERFGYAVVRRHRQLGIPLVIWQDGHVVELPPETVWIPGDDAGATFGVT